MKRRVLALILCLLLLYSCCPAAAASGIMQIKLGTVTAKAGETVDVPVELIDNSGVAGLQIKVVFGDELTLTGVDYTADGVTHLTSQPSAKLTSPVKLTWYNGTANSTYNGVVAVLHFTVAQECTASEIPLTLSINDYDVADVTESNVPFTAVNGAVKLEKKCSHETELKNAVDATCTAAGYSGDAVCKICGETVEVVRHRRSVMIIALPPTHGAQITALAQQLVYAIETLRIVKLPTGRLAAALLLNLR